MKTGFLWFARGAGAEHSRQRQVGHGNIFMLLLAMTATAALAAAAEPNAPAYEENDLVFRAPDGELVGTGAKRPNAEQWAWGEQHMIKAKRVKLNALGLERVNRARKERGEQPLDASQVELAPLGAEAQTAGSDQGAAVPGALPAYVDNSTLKYFPPIRSQGSLGSCAQFSSVYYTMTYMTALARNWDAKSGGDSYRFSPKWTYNMLNGGENVGSWHYDAYAIAQKHGLATWAEFPYDSNYRAWCLNPTAWRNALYVRANQTGKVLDVDTDTGLSQLKQFLVDGYILNFATYINSWQWKAISNDPATTADDVFAGKQCVASVSGTSGGHCMTIVGYNDDIWVDLNGDGVVSANEKGALRIANSWGTSWGEAGFCWLAYQALRTRNSASTSEGIFWYDEAAWVTARASYQPQLIGEFTVNHLTRNQLGMSLGTSATTATSPTTTWYPNRVLYYAGGAWAFDGLTTAIDGTFCLDFTDLLPNPACPKRYYLGMRDSAVGNVATLKSFKLVDLAHALEVPCAAVPQTADGAQAYAYVDYNFGNGTLPPVALFTATPADGDIPLSVTFDGSASYDADGTIASYAWNFGDGSTGTGAISAHTYNQAGTFTATLTVTDDAGAQGAATVKITATDPNVVNAPSGLAASVSGKVVTLRWTDNAGNETGFYVERALKAGKGSGVYARVATVHADVTGYNETVASGSYYYRVQAFNSLTGRLSACSNVAAANVKGK
jgi:C1A family cysteine protease/PKD repeat protein